MSLYTSILRVATPFVTGVGSGVSIDQIVGSASAGALPVIVASVVSAITGWFTINSKGNL